MPATKPITIDAQGATKPAAGVIATRPATAPEAAPSAVGFPRPIHSLNIQPSTAAPVAVLVFTKASVASSFAASALPELKPNQPTQSSAAPTTVKGTLCGGIGSRPKPRRRPIIAAAISAEVPEEMWTTVPPAKSSAPRCISQPPPQTQCASGE